MKIDPTFLRSKVARRIFLLFIFCALVPISALAILSFSQVTGQLEKQSQRRLHQSCKALGMAIFERLSVLENEMEVLSSGLNSNPSPSIKNLGQKYNERLGKRFKGLALINDSGRSIPFFGPIHHPAGQSEEEKQHLMSGKTLLFTRSNGDNPLHVFMMRAADSQKPEQGLLYGEINSLYVLGLSEYITLPSMTELSVLDRSNNVIYSTIPITSSFRQKLAFEMNRSSSGRFQWDGEATEYLASYRSIFLKFRFFSPKWTVVLSVSEDDIFFPLNYFKKVFPLVILLSFWIVLLFTIIQIRRTTLPLEKLKEGTQRISMRDFESRVTVTSGDEFEELAASFNDMARQLGRQFNALTTRAEIDRAILSALETEKIVGTAITHIQEFFGFDFVCVVLLDPLEKNSARAYIGTGKSNALKTVDDIEILPEEVQKLHNNREMLLINRDNDLPNYLAAIAGSGIESFVVFPLFIKQRLAGTIILGSLDSGSSNQEDMLHARQLADQVAVALSNAQLIEELDQLNWGTLSALARTVDAKSHWTAGHSERVTEKALEIGRVMGLSPHELENLHRGGLLHDIGKIGTPVHILDKPEDLNDEEYQIIKGHPRMGARILEPIAAYAHILPMVLQHHESFDGKGYPDGLAREEISLGARILAVADVFDALLTDRPYRKGMGLGLTVENIKKGSGKQFDPDVVQAFLKVLK